MSVSTASRMKYVNLGKSGLKVCERFGARVLGDDGKRAERSTQVSQIILGCMSYGVKRPKDNWTWVLEEEEAFKHLKVWNLDCIKCAIGLT